MNYIDELERIKAQLRAELLMKYSQQPPRGNDVFVQTEPRWLFGRGMVGYEAPYGSGMLSGRIGADKANVNWRNGKHDVDFWLKGNGDASINWSGKF